MSANGIVETLEREEFKVSLSICVLYIVGQSCLTVMLIPHTVLDFSFLSIFPFTKLCI